MPRCMPGATFSLFTRGSGRPPDASRPTAGRHSSLVGARQRSRQGTGPRRQAAAAPGQVPDRPRPPYSFRQRRRRHHDDAGWSSPVARQAHNLKVVGSNPTPATKSTNRANALRGTLRSASDSCTPASAQRQQNRLTPSTDFALGGCRWLSRPSRQSPEDGDGEQCLGALNCGPHTTGGRAPRLTRPGRSDECCLVVVVDVLLRWNPMGAGG